MVIPLLGVSRQSLYYSPKQSDKDAVLVAEIKDAHTHHPAYGHRRMALHLKINHKRTERVMRLNHLKPPRGRHRHHSCTVSTYTHPYTNLIKEIPKRGIAPHYIWVCDVSYFKFQGQFWYLVTIEDMATRQVLSAWVGKYHNAALVLSAIKQAIQVSGNLPTYFHTDQGKEFMAQVVTTYLELQGVKVSVSAKASPWENGYKESFFGRFKEEFGDINRFDTPGELIEEIYSQVHYYNHDRIHTALKMPPVAYAQLLDNLYEKRGT